jgi:heme O synthase-like polyprenyltransferase
MRNTTVAAMLNLLIITLLSCTLVGAQNDTMYRITYTITYYLEEPEPQPVKDMFLQFLVVLLLLLFVLLIDELYRVCLRKFK